MTPLFGARRHPRTAALPVEGHLPGFDGATGWLNSSPLTPAELRGRVVLVNFWTYTCINWLRTLAFVRAWSEKYRDRGLVVIGVHTPEFPFEREAENVREAAQAMRVQYPIALDSDYGIWSAFANRYWPAVYLADAEGRIRYHHFGEGEYDDGEGMIQHLLREARSEDIDQELVSVAAEGLEAQADWMNLRSPETYLGYQQGQNLDSPGGVAYDEPRSYVAPESLQLNTWALGGNWTIEERASVLNEAGGRIAFRFHARDVHLVLRSRAGTAVSFRVLLDGAAPGTAHGLDVDEEGRGTLVQPRLYQLVREPGSITDRTFEIEFLDAGVEAYVFTFG
jgi:thiol-disulfide isomerase/thioredoxin